MPEKIWVDIKLREFWPSSNLLKKQNGNSGEHFKLNNDIVDFTYPSQLVPTPLKLDNILLNV
jgi:hypothetical protein